MLPGSCLSPSLRPLHPSPSPAPAFKLSASAPIVRVNSLSELNSFRPPRAQTPLTRSREARNPPAGFQPSLSHLPRPLASWLEKAGNETFGGASPGDLVLSITSPGRMVGWPSQNRVPLVACSSDE